MSLFGPKVSKISRALTPARSSHVPEPVARLLHEGGAYILQYAPIEDGY
jgi:hypothetical protein